MKFIFQAKCIILIQQLTSTYQSTSKIQGQIESEALFISIEMSQLFNNTGPLSLSQFHAKTMLFSIANMKSNNSPLHKSCFKYTF
jgi:hypothetical protein